jgi:ketosteroid isomerase-like protein
VEIAEELYHQVATFRDGKIVRMEYFAEGDEATPATRSYHQDPVQ